MCFSGASRSLRPLQKLFTPQCQVARTASLIQFVFSIFNRSLCFLPSIYEHSFFSFFFCIQHSRATTQNVWVNKAAQIHDITLKNLRYTSIKKGERNEERNTQGISSRPSCIFVKYNAHTFLGESLLSVIR